MVSFHGDLAVFDMIILLYICSVSHTRVAGGNSTILLQKSYHMAGGVAQKVTIEALRNFGMLKNKSVGCLHTNFFAIFDIHHH